ncbi:kinesin [Angomonas deanei]|nr:kinesin [Angomonas deanei]|eukprot:EPY27389.1 kinesin [Angomonas deanei]
MLGDVKPNPLENDLLTPNSGMFLRVLSDLMDYKLRRAKKGWHTVVGLSCVEIYNDNIRDLFGGNAKSAPPMIKAKMIGDDVLLPDLIIKEMTSLQAVFNELQLAIARRSTRATESNATSSRSHCLFVIDILQQADTAPAPSLDILDITKNKDDPKKAVMTAGAQGGQKKGRTGKGAPDPKDPNAKLEDHEMPFQGITYAVPGQKELIYTSKIILADLAGSERISKTGVTGQGLNEAKSINSSLTALGNVVHSLHEGGAFVNYRDTALTRLLKPTFSQPQSRVLLLAQCSPTQLSFEETISTLHFANKVKAMKVTTATGAEAEKMQFDYLETEKMYDSICCDLHIFQLEMQTRSAIIRRRMCQNKGVYYDSAATTAHGRQKITTNGRKNVLESNGAVDIARKERMENEDRLEAERKELERQRQLQIQEERQKMVEEHRKSLEEVQEQVDQETRLKEHFAEQQMLLDATSIGNVLIAEEAAAWAQLQNEFMKQHQAMCKKELSNTTVMLEDLSKKVNSQRLGSNAAEIPETMEDNRNYSLAAWGHTTAKRFFSSCMELREAQIALLNLSRGNAALEKWKEDHQEDLAKFQAENKERKKKRELGK